MTPEPQRPLKVFLCHAHADRDPVRRLYARLTQDGVDAWLDKEKLLPGQDWEFEIRKAVREADVVVVCLSKQFNEDGFRQKEVKLALDVAMEKREDAIFIIPARLEECDTSDSLRRWHWVDLFEDNGYKKLTQSLSLRSEQVGALFVNINDSELDIPSLLNYIPHSQMNILNNLAKTYELTGDFEKAKNHYIEALKLGRGVNDFKTESIIRSNLGLVNWKMGNFLSAREFLEDALELSHMVDDKKTEISILTNLAFVYQSVGDLVRAIELYERAMAIIREVGL